ncbi:hypothetical protein BCT86_09905 [Vibrio breoganii]|uniref:tyrosine-type recombinase/integrase n=2 Tax=Vibrio breoganii TaxID=553239 RepID=UPI000319A2D0|nr:site-specific integrase [Vibrio breoganii]OED85746.1 hypothetical protein A1QE_10855 [Vibrio breoganii ZF-55]PMG91748.1 hypothetical protein BCU81_18310 [Vibrio breoganii]PML07455.1 hypothetical protein BCT86_09905 [Vibrio breoganii]PML40150.1 hypothetical protein BCT78_18595 [Vibrio breoganii]PML90961.1 hypothetical protein BCT68_17985 [Vibrio breoganii]
MFTVKFLNSLTAKENAYYETDKTRTKGKGRLVVKVLKTGNKVFYFKYFKSKKLNLLKIGDFPNISLSKAREEQEKYSDMLSKDIDPKKEIELRYKLKIREEFEEESCGSIFQLLDSHALHKNKNGKRNYNTEKETVENELYVFIKPETKAKDITTKDLIPFFASMIQRGASCKANKVRSILHAAFNFGMKHDNDPANYNEMKHITFGLDSNPVTAIPVQTHAEKPGDHFLSFSEVYQLWNDLECRYHDLKMHRNTRNAIRLAIVLGGQRPYEVVNTLWSDVNFDDATLTVRAEIFKTAHAHVVPLTDTAIDILKEQLKNKQGPFIFFKTSNPQEAMSTNTIAQALARYRDKTEIRYFNARDFRRTFKTLGGQIGLSKEIRDRVQGHAFNDVSSKHYDRYSYLKEKREALETWEKALRLKTLK